MPQLEARRSAVKQNYFCVKNGRAQCEQIFSALPPILFQFQIRTFWIGLLYLAIGIPLRMVLIGIPVLGWWLLWSLIRIIKGFIALNDNEPIANPGCWRFG